MKLREKSTQSWGGHNEDAKENKAFIAFSKHLKKAGMNVPVIYAEDLENGLYLVEDFGVETLFEHILVTRVAEDYPKQLKIIYKHILEDLVQFHIVCRERFTLQILLSTNKF